MKKIHIILVCGLLFSLGLHVYADFEQECQTVRAGTLRLHIIANSDTDIDQAMKLEVRDAILAQSPELFEQAVSVKEAETQITGKLGELQSAARHELLAHGYDYPVRTELVNMFFATNRYDSLTVPAGRYNAVRLTIGEGRGKNWWCVMFPPMCLPAASETPSLEEALSGIGSTPHYVPKLAVVELVENIRERLSGGEDKVLAQAGMEEDDAAVHVGRYMAFESAVP